MHSNMHSKFGIEQRQNMKILPWGNYHNVYLATDLLLLADVFETFWGTCLKHYKLDPVHFYTEPGSEYCEHEKRCKDCVLCLDEFSLELLTDIDMMLMFEKGTRGGITQAVKRFEKATNKYMNNLYNPDEESIYLQYLDENNLYRWAMVQKLPTQDFYGKRQRTLPLKK